MKTYRIIPLPMSYCEIDTGVFTYRCNYGKKSKSTSYIWYIEGATQNIIVDSGSDSKLREQFRGIKTGVDIMSFEDALAKVNLKPDEVDLIIQTHLHWDHVGNAHKCKNAKVLVQEAELKYAFAPDPFIANTYAPHLLKGLDYQVINGYHTIEPGIEILPSPGHSPGGQSVSVNTEKGKAVIAGWCCIQANFNPPDDLKRFVKVLPSGGHTNALENYQTALRIYEMADILIPSHDYSYVNTECIP
jgi:N-acyl homoserine lactone hydrolase